MFILYDLIFLIFAVIYLPIYLCKRKFHQGFLLRLGILPRDLALDRPIWLHAVSVGEVMAVRGLLETLREIYPDKKFVISTVTPSGNTIAKGIAKDRDYVTYLPLDFSFFIRSVIDRINPSLFIVAETEIWPNLITALSKHKVPIVVVNARISDKSFRGYRAIKILLKPILNKINAFCVQSKLDAERLVKLGLSQNKIQITGNMKFDLKPQVLSFDTLNLKILREDETLWVCGSTHPQEEEIILDTYKKLLGEFRDLRLLIAPRHPERAKEIEKIVIKYGFSPTKVSQLASERVNGLKNLAGEPANRLTGTPEPANRQTVFILDTIGQLLNYYAIADIVFVGGSLVRKGGHNILEPALQGKPVMFGPYMFNFRDIVELFLKEQAAILVRNQQELRGKIKYLLKNPKAMDELSSRAKNLIGENQGATLRNSQIIKKVYAGISLPRYKNPNLWTKFCNGVYNLATDRSKGFIANIIKVFLFLLSLVYGLAVRMLVFFYHLKPYCLNCKVISVGNITLGGTGKTSLVEYIARYLKQQGHKVAVISRGYKKKTKRYPLPPKADPPLAENAIRYENMGDEPFMLSKKLGDVSIIVDSDRIRAVKCAIKDYVCDTVILDDAFQQWKLKKDLEIVTIDATNPFGNQYLIPRGILREPIASLRRADIFVLTKTNLMPNVANQEVFLRHPEAAFRRDTTFGNPDILDLQEFLSQINPAAEVFKSLHKPKGFYKIDKPDELLSLQELRGKTVTLFSGIGDPNSFENLVAGLGINVGLVFRFRDHHSYTQSNLDKIVKASQDKGIDTIITTEKDAARLDSAQCTMCSSAQFLVLRITIAIKDEQRFHNRLLRLYSL